MIGLARENSGKRFLKRHFNIKNVQKISNIKGLPDFYLPELGLWIEQKAASKLLKSLFSKEQLLFAEHHKKQWFLLFFNGKKFFLYNFKKINNDIK